MDVSMRSQTITAIDMSTIGRPNRIRYTRKSVEPAERFDVELEFPDSPLRKRYIERSAATLNLAD